MVGVHFHNSAHDNRNWGKIYDNLRWLTGLKLIQLEQQKTTSAHYFSEKFKTNTLQDHKRYMKIFEYEMNNLRIQILTAKMTLFHLKILPFANSKSL